VESEFGRLVRQRRERVTPDSVGMPAGGRRRTAGLRREELAMLAGISTDYLTRLEQGRATAPSAQVVESLARALRVDDAERDLLFRLAGHATPGRDVVPARITPSVQRLLDRMAHTPVAVFDAAFTLLTANAAYNALVGDTTAWRGLERNAVWRHVTGATNRIVHSRDELADLVRYQVAELRLVVAKYPADRQLARLVRDLHAAGPAFGELWASTDPTGPRDPSRRKTVEHPEVGPIRLDCDTLVVAGDDLRIMVYTAEPGTEDADRLALAIVLGTQSLVD
jgi:transcriptional regulator with XRE-family HTH domain